MEEEGFSLEIFKIEPTDTNASLAYKHWFKMFNVFMEKMEKKHKENTNDKSEFNRLQFLKAYISPGIWNYIYDQNDFEQAKYILNGCYLHSSEFKFAKILLERRLQQPDESLTEYAYLLDNLAKLCEKADIK